VQPNSPQTTRWAVQRKSGEFLSGTKCSWRWVKDLELARDYPSRAGATAAANAANRGTRYDQRNSNFVSPEAKPVQLVLSVFVPEDTKDTPDEVVEEPSVNEAQDKVLTPFPLSDKVVVKFLEIRRYVDNGDPIKDYMDEDQVFYMLASVMDWCVANGVTPSDPSLIPSDEED
jgi:hypothetical protein